MLAISSLLARPYPLLRRVEAAHAVMNQQAQRLASARRINGAADDAAGLGVAERLSAQARGLMVAQRGLQDGRSMVSTADGALGQVSQSLQRMRELAVQAGNGTLAPRDAQALQAEYRQLGEQVQQVLGGTRFNGRRVLADDAGPMSFPAGASPQDTLTITTHNLRADTDITAASGASVSSSAGARQAVEHIDRALGRVGQQRAVLGAGHSRLQAAAEQMDSQYQATATSHSRLVDTDFAQTASLLASSKTAHYAAIAMLAKSNAAPRALLSLLA